MFVKELEEKHVLFCYSLKNKIILPVSYIYYIERVVAPPRMCKKFTV